MEKSYFDITFDQTVAITEYFYPSLSLSMLCADLGGSLGLWLGVGLLQLCVNALDFIKNIRLYLTHMYHLALHHVYHQR